MASSPTTPIYRHHRQSGRGILTVRNHLGARQDILLPGPYGSQESKDEYDRIVGILKSNRGTLPAPDHKLPDLTVSELILRYMTEHVNGYYVDPVTKKPTSEVWCIKQAMRPLKRLYGDIPASEFDGVKLMIVRDSMIAGAWMNPEEQKEHIKAGRQIGLARTTINKALHRIRAMIGWAVCRNIVPETHLVKLKEVKGLRRGRSQARETEPVVPIAPELVKDTMEKMPPIVRDMVELQLLTGARPGEICSMRANDIDMTGSVWLYRPQRHKTAWLGHKRTIAIGPRGQTIVRKYLKPRLDAYLFSPAEQEVIIAANKRTQRKTPVQPSQVNRRKRNAQRKPRDHFNVTAYNRAITRACERAKAPKWHAHQLRHTAALLIERDFGVEAARACLGHRSVDMTTLYSGIDTAKAATVAARIG